MGVITEIKVAKGAQARRHIYIDDKFATTLDEFTVYKYRLAEGAEISFAELEKIAIESESARAFEQAIKLISRFPKTKKQMYDYFIAHGYLPALGTAVVQKLLDYRYIDDAAYARNFVNLNEHKYGKKKLKLLLSARGVSNEIIAAVLESLPSQKESVQKFAQKYMRNKEFDKKNLSALGRYLYGKGFEWAEINSVINEMRDKNDENWD